MNPIALAIKAISIAGKSVSRANKSLALANKTIGDGGPSLIIAELGVNHDGDLRRALELVDAAAGAGADAIKLQFFRADRLMHSSSAFAEYQKSRSNEPTPTEMLRRYELSDEDAKRIVDHARERGLIPLATPFSPEDVDLIAQLDLPAIKIASPDLVNWPLLKRAAAIGKPMIVSTGAATIDEVAMTLSWLVEWTSPLLLMHCTSIYPVNLDEANLCWLSELSDRFNVPIGFSDHTTTILSGALAIAGGACAIEKHLTYDRRASGPDHSASADPHQFREYVNLIREAERLRGKPGKKVLDVEQDVRHVSRQSLVARRDLKAGEEIREADLTVQRPGTGISAAMMPAVIGKMAKRNIERGEMLNDSMFAD